MEDDILQVEDPISPEEIDEAEAADVITMTATEAKARASITTELLAQLDDMSTQLTQLQDTHARTLAEYANYKRRTEQEKAQLGAFTTGELLSALLPTLDNFERAEEAEMGDAYRTGIDMAFAALKKTLADRGLEEIDPLDQPFDPSAHNAVLREEAAEGEPADIVIQVLQKGYRLGDRILRPAMVKVRS